MFYTSGKVNLEARNKLDIKNAINEIKQNYSYEKRKKKSLNQPQSKYYLQKYLVKR